MKKFFLITWLLLSFFSVKQLNAQIDTTRVVSPTEETEQIEDNLDTLMSTWYIKNSLDSNSSTPVISEIITNLPDSVYIARLQKIPAIMPLTYNDIVKKWIEMYLKRGKYLVPSLIGMSDYYFPMFEEALDANEMPLELKYLPIIESALNPRAVSRAGATGLWQFMYSTGKMYNLEINSLVDNRRDPIKSTQAAVTFLKDMYATYGDWTLVIAAYNCGPGNVNKAIRRAKGKTNYWEIYPYLPRETRGYVPAFIAATYIMNYYKLHNIAPVKVELPTKTDTVMINKQLHLMQVAEVLKLPIEQLRDMNPQYRKDIIPGDITPYSLKLPISYSEKFIDLADSIYTFKDSVFFDPRYATIAPPEYTASRNGGGGDDYSPCEPSKTAGKAKLTYTVKPGDNFGFIANWYDVNVSDLKCWNNAFNNRLSVGQKITVWVPMKKLRIYQNVDNLTFEEKQKQVDQQIVATAKTFSGQNLDANFVYYTIKSGDNIATIAKKYNGVSEQDIMNINGFTTSDVRKLQIGQVIKIKRK